jgi:hypothetical protein
LALIKAMNLIHKQNSLLAKLRHIMPCLFNCLTDFFDARKNG